MAAVAVSPIFQLQGEGETFWSFGALTTVKASAETTGGRVGVIELLAAKGAGSPMHVHHREDEWFYVTEGELTFWVGGRVIHAPAGAFVFGPRDIPHTFLVSSELARCLLVIEPAGFEKFMRELSQPALTPTPPPPLSEPPDMELIASTAARYGIEILGPLAFRSKHSMKNPLNVVAAIGLALGGVFGMAGTFVSQANLRSTFWGVDGTCLVVATAILALKFFRLGSDAVAAGFLVFAIGEGVMLSGTAQPLDAMVPSFCAGTALWAAALLLTSVPKTFAVWIRLVSVVGASLFAATSARILWGERILPTASPLPSFAYPFLVLAFIGWIWTLMRES